MKKILFVINNLETGGVQISLQNLLREIHNYYDITVLSFFCKDEYRKLIPEDVKLIGLKSPFRFFGVSQNEVRKTPAKFIARAFWAVLTKLFGRSFVIKIMSLFQKKIGTYDCAISFLHEGPQKSVYGGCNEFVLKKVEAKKKIAWLHCDFALCGANNKRSERIYRKFDRIVACSEGAKRSFLQCMPQFEDKCIAIRNCNDYEHIRELAGQGIAYNNSFFNIVTVARLSQEKGIDRAIIAVKNCIDKGYKVRYHIVGSGAMEEKLKALVAESDLNDDIIFYGNQTNPYPYIKGADLFLLSSYHEASPMVFDEAACLGVPVLATETTSTDEMIIQSNSGFVCENSQDGITNSLLSLMRNVCKLAAVEETLNKRTFTNDNNIRAFCSLVDGESLLVDTEKTNKD